MVCGVVGICMLHMQDIGSAGQPTCLLASALSSSTASALELARCLMPTMTLCSMVHPCMALCMGAAWTDGAPCWPAWAFMSLPLLVAGTSRGLEACLTGLFAFQSQSGCGCGEALPAADFGQAGGREEDAKREPSAGSTRGGRLTAGDCTMNSSISHRSQHACHVFLFFDSTGCMSILLTTLAFLFLAITVAFGRWHRASQQGLQGAVAPHVIYTHYAAFSITRLPWMQVNPNVQDVQCLETSTQHAGACAQSTSTLNVLAARKSGCHSSMR
jgi:hypothetical protein